MTEPIPDAKAWHASSLAEVWKAVDSNELGLSQDQALARLKTFGPNSLPHESPPTWWQILLHIRSVVLRDGETREVDESLLTGESLAVAKDADWVAIESAPAADRLNLACAASIIVRGRAKGVVVSTGSATVAGQLAVDMINVSGGRPPLLDEWRDSRIPLPTLFWQRLPLFLCWESSFTDTPCRRSSCLV